MRPRTMLLAVSALVTLRCSSDGASCPDGSKIYGFCAAPDGAPPDDAASRDDGPLMGFFPTDAQGIIDTGIVVDAADDAGDAGQE